MESTNAKEAPQNEVLSNLSKTLLQRSLEPAPVLRRKPKRKHQKNNQGLDQEKYQETSYYFKDNLRWVYPYSFTFTACVKKRWFGHSVLRLFTEEFHAKNEEYYKRAIASGKIKVNDENATEDQQLKNKDVIKNIIHRHEPPVLHQDITFISNNDEVVVIDKPPSIPVYPSGRYRHNSIVFILAKEHNLHGLHVINRVERSSSGVLMFSKNAKKAKEMTFQVHKTSNVEKEFLARVVGEFPPEEMVVKEPILTASREVGVCYVNEDGDKCSTKFKRLSFNGKSSVVSCKAVSIRMHQIRVHLHWLGHPIVNDPIYNHPTAWGNGEQVNDINKVVAVLAQTMEDPSNGDGISTDADFDSDSPKRRKSADDVDSSVGEMQQATSILTAKENKNCGSDSVDDNGIPVVSDGRLKYTVADIGEGYVDADCNDCKRTWEQPLPSELLIYLHVLCYKGFDWKFKSSTPDWAMEEWDVD